MKTNDFNVRTLKMDQKMTGHGIYT